MFRGLALASAVLAFAIAILGSWVRINDAGLTCPDWPLCRGELVPSLHGGVILEWSHRLVAFVEGFVVVGAIVAGFRVRDRIAGVTRVLVALGAIFVIQVSLGGATVLLANSPLSVMLHWAMGMALLATLTTLAILAIVAPQPGDMGALRAGPPAPAVPLLGLAALCAFATMCLGAYVSSSYAGLACGTFPSCDGTWLGGNGAQFVQMLHRIAAGTFAVVAIVAIRAALQHASRRVRGFAVAGGALVVLQIGLGIGNVVWRLPVAMREAHAANAGATFLCFVIAAVLAALEPYRAARRASERSVPARRTASA